MSEVQKEREGHLSNGQSESTRDISLARNNGMPFIIIMSKLNAQGQAT